TVNPGPYVKDGIGDRIVHGRLEAANGDGPGTKVASHHVLDVKAGSTSVVRLRLSDRTPAPAEDAFGSFDETFAAREREADDFYHAIVPPNASEDEARVMRQAFAGLLCGKQYYFFDADRWLTEHGVDPFLPAARAVRNREWAHM